MRVEPRAQRCGHIWADLGGGVDVQQPVAEDAGRLQEGEGGREGGKEGEVSLGRGSTPDTATFSCFYVPYFMT